MIVSTLPPRVFLDSGQSGSGLASDDATRNMSNAKGAADSVFCRGPILFYETAYTVDDDPAGYVWQGYGEDITTLTGANNDCDGAVFCSMQLTGDFDDTTPTGPFRAENCQLHNLRGQFNANGCRISGTLKPVDHCVLNDCDFSQDEAGVASVPVIDLTNCTSLVITNCRGRFDITNRNSATGTYRIYGGGGVISLKSSCVQWAVFEVKGAWQIIERANGASAPVTDYSDGRDAATSRGQHSGNFAGAARATFVVSGAQTLADTAIEVTAGVQGLAGDVLTVPDTGEVMVITSLSGTTFNVTRGAFGTIAQPIANGARMDLVFPRVEINNTINLLISVVASLLTTTNNGIIILDDKLNRLFDLARGIVDSQTQYRGATTGTVTNVATTFNVTPDPQAGGVVIGSRITNLRTGEVMLVTNVTSGNVSATRGVSGTTAQAMNSGDPIYEYQTEVESLVDLTNQIASVFNSVIDTYNTTLDILSLATSMPRVEQKLVALIAEASSVDHVVVGFHSQIDTVIQLDDAAGIAVGDWVYHAESGELALVGAVNTGTDQITITRGVLNTGAVSWTNGNRLFFMQRKEIIRHVLNLFRDNALTVVGGGGERTVTIYEEDGITIKAQVEISADGLTRTRIV